MELTKIFREFFNSEKLGGMILLLCTILSLAIANSSYGEAYLHFWHSDLDLSFSFVHLNYSVEHWINDGLMTVFFLLVGLEIERELYKGELAQLKNAVLPIGAAIGGMLFPAAIYFLITLNAEDNSGFGIPMATDIAFALGILALAGSRIPTSLKIFLTALAIIDDLGAILVIAVFYNSGLAWGYLAGSFGIFVLLMIMNKAGIKKLIYYLLPGVVMWYCMLQSGVHATITGVLLAFAIPFGQNDDSNPSYLLQHALHKPVAFLILPVFALANTGIVLAGDWHQEMWSSANNFGIICGLVIGKPLGILFVCLLLIKLKIARLPASVSWRHLAGAGILAGIGFTMSIFISNLAFTNPEDIQYSKIAVLLASLIATVAGLSVLFTVKKPLGESK